MSKPTFDQMAEFFRQVEAGRVTRGNFQDYLRNPSGFGAGQGVVSYDQSIGLRALIERAVGLGNFGNISGDITQERFPLQGTSVRTVKLAVEPYRNGETSEQAAERLLVAGHKLANTGDLAGFLHDHPEEVEKWARVLAISEDSRWTHPDGRVCVPCADVDGARRYFYLYDFRDQLSANYGALVLGE